jgi:hypothetical protein
MVQFVKLLEPNGKDYVFINPEQICRVGNPSPGEPIVRNDLAGGQMQVVKGPLADVVAAIESQERVS